MNWVWVPQTLQFTTQNFDVFWNSLWTGCFPLLLQPYHSDLEDSGGEFAEGKLLINHSTEGINRINRITWDKGTPIISS